MSRRSEGHYFDSINPATEERLASVADWRARQTSTAPSRRPAKRTMRPWSKMKAAERGKYIYRIARILQERAREFCCRSNHWTVGKPIRESRDIDMPLSAAHFFLLRGLGRQARVRVPGAPAAFAGRRGAGDSLELPVAHGVLENRTRARLRQHRRTETGGDDAADSDEACGSDSRCRPAGRRREHRHGAGDTGAAIVNHDNVDKIAFTGSTEVGRIIQRCAGGYEQEIHARARRQGREHHFADAAIDQAVEGIVNGIFFNQGHVCCAGSRLFVQESVADEVISKLRDRMETLIVGDPLDKNTDIGAINSRTAARND